METEKVLVAMSGGVDSSVAAKLLTDAGFSCIGCTMKLYDNEDAGIPKANTCCSLDDVEDARSVAYRLGMPYYVFNLKENSPSVSSTALWTPMSTALRRTPASTATAI